MGRVVWTMSVLATYYVGQMLGAKPCIGQASGASLALDGHQGAPCNYISYRFSNFGFHRLNHLTAQAGRMKIFFPLIYTIHCGTGYCTYLTLRTRLYCFLLDLLLGEDIS